MLKRWMFLGCAALLGSACNSAPSGGTASGAETYQLCARCHGPDARGNPELDAPSLAGLPAWYIEAQLVKFRDGGRGMHPDDRAGMQMRPIALSLRNDVDIKSVAEHVSKMPPRKPAATVQGGDPQRGATLFATCAACHGQDGSGNEATRAPALKHANDWYLLAQLDKFKQGIRGANTADSSGALMRPMAQTLKDEQSMKDVVAYISTLR